MSAARSCRSTVAACFLGQVCQTAAINFAPLLFLTFQSDYGVPLEKITLLVTLNFTVQLLTDLAASRFVQRIGVRQCLVGGHLLCCLGMVLLPILPDVLGGFAGLLAATAVYALGGGLLEVLVSPTLEACPTKNKAGLMSLMHSFYCWGVVATVLLSTGFFMLFGIEHWKLAAFGWALLPAVNAVLFLRVPLYPMAAADGDRPNYGELFSQRIFWLMLLFMLCSGACEQAVCQWASAFAERALGVPKAAGDLLGMCGFAVLMGLSRTLYARCSNRLPLKVFMMCSACLCVASYLMIGTAALPALGLLGCVVCGFSVGVFWPGTLSLATRTVRRGGTTMFALLSLAGDLGCMAGPTVVGFVSGALGSNLKFGILAATTFPVALLLGLLLLRRAPAGPETPRPVDREESV